MTLIACIMPRKQPFLIADVLTSSQENRDEVLILPTRAYLPPEKLRQMSMKPAGFARKLFEVNPRLVVAFAGNPDHAVQFAERIRDWFLNCDVTNDFIVQFLQTYYSTKLRDFGVIIGALLPDRFQSYWVGQIVSGSSERWGDLLVGGSGMKQFANLVFEPADFLAPLGGTEAGDPLTDVLMLAGEFVAREMIAPEPITANFGGAYEVIAPTAEGFFRIDDVWDMFVDVNVDDLGGFILQLLPTWTRQWYQEDCLYVLSGTTKRFEDMGTVKTGGFVIPGILCESASACPEAQLPPQAAPNYLCLHVMYRYRTLRTAQRMVLPGSGYINFTASGHRIDWELTDRLKDHIADIARQLVEHPRRQAR